jgi:putative ABC transport system permease protein
MRMVLLQGMQVIAIGLAAGIVSALIFSRVMRALLFETPVNDPITFAGVAVIFLAVGFLASYVPARRVTKVDPLIALRSE